MSDMSDSKQVPAHDGAILGTPQPKRSRKRAVLMVGAALLLAGAGAAWIAAPKSSERTDDAYLRADETSVAPEVRARITEVLVRDHQTVKAGQPLVRLDAQDLDARVRSSEADVASAQASVEAASAALLSLAAEEKLSASNIHSVQTGIAAANARLVRATADNARATRLVQSGAIPQRDADLARTAASDAQADADRSLAVLAVSRDQGALIRTRRASLKAALVQAEAGVARSKAQLALARQEQSKALISAPVDGVVGALQARVGDYVQPGTALMTLVPMEKLYVLAYFKETQTARMMAGQAAYLEIDAMPGEKLRGKVDSFAPGTGAQFALLPFEPGTGNFTKIVQRVPVRISFNAGQEALVARLRPGLSVTAEVGVAQ